MKSTYLKALIFSLALFFISSASFSQKQLFIVTTDTGSVAEKFDSTTTGPKINIKVDKSLLTSNSNQQIKIFLPDGIHPKGVQVIAKKTKQEANSYQFAWYGKLVDQPRSFVLLTQVNDVIAGHIRTNDDKIYRITYIGNNVHQIRLIEQRFFRPDRVDLPGNIDPIRNELLKRESAACCDTSVMDVLVVYTPNTKRAAGGSSGINSQIFESINITNESFINSNIPVKIELAHSEMIQYQETGSIEDDRNALQDPRDGIMDNVHPLRDQYHADIVVLLVENSNYSGIGYIMDAIAPAFESKAFCVVRLDAAISNLSFAHEIGHIMGARHECNADNGLTPFPYSHGYSFDRSRTIMSTNIAATRVEFWSGPNLKFPATNNATGSRSGDCQADDAECLRNTFAVVCKFRCRQQCTSAEPSSTPSSFVNPQESTVTRNSTVEIPPITTIEQTVTPNPIISSSSKHSNNWLIIITIVIIIVLILWFILKRKKDS